MLKDKEPRATTKKINLIKPYLLGSWLNDVNYQDTVVDALYGRIRSASVHDREYLVEQ
jgi:hypothetical protein